MLRMECNHCGKSWTTYEHTNCPDCESNDVTICSSDDIHECDGCGSSLKVMDHDFIMTCQGCGRKWKLIHGLLEET